MYIQCPFRIHHGAYQTSRRVMPFQYGYPYFMMNPSHNGKFEHSYNSKSIVFR